MPAMSLANALVSEIIGIAAYEPPDSQTSEIQVPTAYVNVAAFPQYRRFLILLLVGEMAATSTLDMDIEQATSAAGAGLKIVTGKSITQLTAAGSDSDKYVGVELRVDELDLAGGFTFFKAEVTPATAAVELAVIILGVGERYMDLATTGYDELVT